MLAHTRVQHVQAEDVFHAPLILDEILEYPDEFSSRYSFASGSPNGLLAKTVTVLSMSDYVKSHPTDLIGLVSSRPSHESLPYGFSNATAYGPTIQLPSNPQSETSDGDHVRYVNDTDYLSEATYGSRRSSVTQSLPTVTSFSPRSGLPGFLVYLSIQCPYDLLSAPATSLSILFASKRCLCVVESAEAQSGCFSYVLSAEIPDFGSTGWHAFTIPLRLLLEIVGQSQQSVTLGTFTYEEVSSGSSAQMSRKRRASEDAGDDAAHPSKKPSIRDLSIKQNADAAAFNQQLSASPYSPFLSTPTSTNAYSTAVPPQSSPPRTAVHRLTTASNPPRSALRVPSPRTPSWSPSFSMVDRQVRSSANPVSPSQQPDVSTSTAVANPPLIRTSTIQHPQSSITMGLAAHPGQSFNPYAMYPHKAVLKLSGNLDSMVEDWTSDEWATKRRLVCFTRRQNGSTIRADFKPVIPEERPANSICISCIYWAGKNECFITSVDTIYLLESLVAVRFTVEEKNRIRRNLEGFRPLTVSKSKPESEDFFKTIMGFPNPKPRNIEKDVKVFPWKILGHALKKIIGKYSASYSSTAGALLTPTNSAYNLNPAHDLSTSSHRIMSPQQISGPTGLNAYTGSYTTIASPDSSQTVTTHDPRGNVPQIAYPYTSAPPGYVYGNMELHSMSTPITAAMPRGGWDYNHLLRQASTPTVASTQATYYVPTISYSTNHPTSGA